MFSTPVFLAPTSAGSWASPLAACSASASCCWRHYVPESPRWLVIHGSTRRVDATILEIEERVARDTGEHLREPQGRIEVRPHRSFGLGLIVRSMFGKYRTGSILALALMIAQAFLFNAVFFSYGLVLATFHGLAPTRTGLFPLPLAVSNFLGPLLLGPLFDTVGRRIVIAGTYAAGGGDLLFFATAVVFGLDVFSAWTQTIAWMLIFFFASAAASSAYLTASEIFPLEKRALAIAVFYAFGTAVGGTFAPWLFGFLLSTGSTWVLGAGHMLAAMLMLAAALVEAKVGIDAEGRSLEQIADPLCSG
jgi:MFS family permease